MTDGLSAQQIDAGLVRGAQTGDEGAFTELMQRHERQIFSFIYGMMGDADDADDLTQDTFVKAYQALPRFGADSRVNLSAWLHRIASNACLDVLRRRQRLRWIPWEGPKHDQMLVAAPAGEPERAAVSQEARATVQQVLNRMGQRHRMALVLREMEDLSCAEVGEVMGISRSAVKSMLFRAREEFRRVYARVEAAPVPPQRRQGVA